jgi:gamma-glutamyltranspeptidase/glutathione hydrolase
MFFEQHSVQFTKKLFRSIRISALFFTQLVQPPVALSNMSGDIIDYHAIHHPEIGQGGMVSTQNKLATQVGIHILKQGGNAIDAAVAVGFALAVTLPRAGNIGGGGFMLVYHAATQKTFALDYYGQAPGQITPTLLLETSTNPHKKRFSHQSVAIPGTVAGLWEAHHRFGQLPWKKLIEPAIRLAHHGIRLSFDEARALKRRKNVLTQDAFTAKTFFKPNGEPYQPGEIFKQPDLAWSLTQIRDHGKDAFYKGTLAQRFISGIQQQGGILTLKDLAQYSVNVSTPVWSTYRHRYTIACTPPPASGIVLASIMNILEHFPLTKLGANTAESIHILAEAFKLGRHDFNFIGRHPKWRIPISTIVDKAYAKQRAQCIQMNRTLSPQQVGTLQTHFEENENTTHYTIADAQGNVVSNTYTLSDSYGAHVVAPRTGILLNNTLRNLAWSSKSPEIRQKSRSPTPYQRIPSSITPLIVFKDNKPWLATGSLGGGHIPGVLAQVLVNVIDHQLNIAEATMRPRVGQFDANDALLLEHGIPDDLILLLQAKGHRIQRTRIMGGVQSILIEQGFFQGAADSRRPSSTAMAVI